MAIGRAPHFHVCLPPRSATADPRIQVKLREGKPVDIPESEEESDGEGGAGKDEEGEGGAADGGAEVRGRNGERSPLQTFQAHYMYMYIL